MAEVNPLFALQAAEYTAKNFRRVLDAIVNEAVTSFNGDDDLKVVENSPTGMSVRVSRGGAFVQGDDTSDQGSYFVYNDGYEVLSIAAADGTNPRKDIVIFRVKDSTEGVTGDVSELAVVTGTPAAAPSEPALPNTAIKLATVTVAAGASSIVNADITDRRSPETVGQANFVEDAINAVGPELTTSYQDIYDSALDEYYSSQDPAFYPGWIPPINSWGEGTDITLTRAGIYVVKGSCIFQQISLAASPGILEMCLEVDGVIQSLTAKVDMTIQHVAIMTSRAWVVTLGTGTHTLKLRAKKSVASSSRYRAGLARITAMWMKEA